MDSINLEEFKLESNSFSNLPNGFYTLADGKAGKAETHHHDDKSELMQSRSSPLYERVIPEVYLMPISKRAARGFILNPFSWFQRFKYIIAGIIIAICCWIIFQIIKFVPSFYLKGISPIKGPLLLGSSNRPTLTPGLTDDWRSLSDPTLFGISLAISGLADCSAGYLGRNSLVSCAKHVAHMASSWTGCVGYVETLWCTGYRMVSSCLVPVMAKGGRLWSQAWPPLRPYVVIGLPMTDAIVLSYVLSGESRRRRVLTWVIDQLSRSYQYERIRDEFRQLQPPVVKPWSHGVHSHPMAAARRSAARVVISQFAEFTGLRPFSISMSSRDMRSKWQGVRDYYFIKDLFVQSRHDTIDPDHIIVMVDVDYYVDLSAYVSMGRPIIMYTFIPTTAGGQTENGVFSLANNRVRLRVDGGAVYEHELWDYSTDVAAFHYWWGTIAVTVDLLRMGVDRAIVLITPMRRVYTPSHRRVDPAHGGVYTPVARLLSGPVIGRRCLNFRGLSYVGVSENGHQVVSIAREGDELSVSLRALETRCSLRKEFTLSDIERNIIREGEKDAHVNAGILYPLLQLYLGAESMPPLPRDFSYQCLAPLRTERGVNVGQVLHAPIVDGAVLPRRSYNNDSECVLGRIDSVRNDMKRFPEDIDLFGKEFAQLLIPEPGLGVPYSIAEINDWQDRPSQRALAAAAEPVMHTGAVGPRSFQKAETYPKVCSPRNITTVHSDHRLRYGGYTRSFSDKVLKETHWYAFGLTPRDLAVVVAKAKRQGLNFAAQTDFSRFDGHHSQAMVDYELKLLLRYFQEGYHLEVTSLQQSQYHRTGYTRFGVRYDIGTTRLSGSSDTSAMNSVINAFVAYATLRRCGLERAQAWDSLGLYGGDDGLTFDVSPEAYEQTAMDFGLKLKPLVPHLGSSLTFLGRIYPDPWVDPGNICDVSRQVRKLHLSAVSKVVPKEVVMRRRAEGWLITDPYTPLISNWARAIVRLFPEVQYERYEAHLRGEDYYFSRFASDEQFKPPQIPFAELVSFVAEVLQTDSDVVFRICNQLDSARSLTEFPMDEMQHLSAKVEVSAEIDGEVVGTTGDTINAKKEVPAECAATKVAHVAESTSTSAAQSTQELTRRARKRRRRRTEKLTTIHGL
ncbi:hypothetical protein ACOME3_002270 [Neoechinorhynchus agilis]